MNNLKTRKEFSAGVIVYRESQTSRKYLLLHYPGGYFDFPKGHLEQGETEKIAAVRELFEETGIKNIDICQEFKEAIHYQFRHQGVLILKTVTFFLGQTTQSEVTISDEHQGYLWLDFDTALSKMSFDDTKNLINKAHNFLNNLK